MPSSGGRLHVGWFLVAAALAPGRAAAAPEQPGAGCIDCHEAVVRSFATNPHAAAWRSGQAGDCASCHAGADAHAQAGGDPALVRGGPRDRGGEHAGEACAGCHAGERRRTFWQGSAHAAAEVGCAACHSVHGGNPGLLTASTEPATCLTCHNDVRADLLKRTNHGLRAGTSPGAAGRVTCSSCHNPHGARSRALVDARSVNDKCFECHAEKRAPVLWEHSPVKEDCMICHTAHGSSHEGLLVQRVPRLCQECHLQGRHNSGTLGAASSFAVNRSCLNCHTQIHGSNNPSGPILMR